MRAGVRQVCMPQARAALQQPSVGRFVSTLHCLQVEGACGQFPTRAGQLEGVLQAVHRGVQHAGAPGPPPAAQVLQHGVSQQAGVGHKGAGGAPAGWRRCREGSGRPLQWAGSCLASPPLHAPIRAVLSQGQCTTALPTCRPCAAAAAAAAATASRAAGRPCWRRRQSPARRSSRDSRHRCRRPRAAAPAPPSAPLQRGWDARARLVGQQGPMRRWRARHPSPNAPLKRAQATPDTTAAASARQPAGRAAQPTCGRVVLQSAPLRQAVTHRQQHAAPLGGGRPRPQRLCRQPAAGGGGMRGLQLGLHFIQPMQHA